MTISASNPRPELTHVRYSLSVWLAAAAAIAYLCRVALSVAEKTIRLDLGISEDQMGWIFGPVFFWSYALTQIPGGWLGERFGSRRMLPLFSVMWSAGIAVCRIWTGTWLLTAGRLAMGVAQGGLFPCVMHTVSRWYPGSERGFTSGILTASMQGGAALATILTGTLLVFLDWRTVFMLYAIPGLIWSIGFYIWFRDDPSQHPSVNEAEYELIQRGKSESAGAAARPKVPWKRMLTSRAMWTICAQQFCNAGGVAFFSTWFATYLQETRGVTTQKSAWLLAIPFLAAGATALLGGRISDAILRRSGNRSRARKSLAVTTLLSSGALVMSAYYIENATLATIVISTGLSCAAVAATCAYAVTIDMGGAHVAAVFATMNLAGNLGTGLIPFLVPRFRRLVENSPQALSAFDGNSWNAVLILFAAMYFLAAFFWMLLRVQGTVFDASASEESTDD